MEENPNIQTVPPEPQTAPTPPLAPQLSAEERKTRTWMIVGAVVLTAALGGFLAWLISMEPGQTSHIRDIFIIFIAVEALVLGVALIILITQVAVLINLLQNEVKPILNSTNETVSTLRGTVTFLSNNLVQPVIKLNQYLAALKHLIDIVNPGRR
jgi:hypothetical protein